MLTSSSKAWDFWTISDVISTRNTERTQLLRRLCGTNLALLILGMVVCASPAWSQDRYVDGELGSNSNPGTLTDPWRTIQYAVDEVGPGQTIFVRAGTYNEVITFEGIEDSGSDASGPVVLAAFEGEVPVIDGAGLSPAGRQGLISVLDAEYIQIRGFELRDFRTSSSGDTPIGFLVEGACPHVEFVDNVIHGIRQEHPSDGGANGIGVYGTDSFVAVHDLLLEGNEVRDCRLMFSEAFVLNGNVRDFVVRGNTVRDCDNIGFDFIGYEGECQGCTGDFGENVDRARDGQVESNTALGIDTIDNPAYGGERSAAGFYVDGGANIVFERNVSSENNLGFELASEHFGRATEGIIVRNNFIHGCDIAGLATGGYSSGNGEGGGEARDNYFVNNTLYSNTQSDRPEDDWGAEILLQNRNIDNTFKNNVVYARSGRPRVSIAGSLNSGNVWGNQLYYGSDGGTAPGSVSLEDPRLMAPEEGDLHLLADSPAFDFGESLPQEIGGSVDFDGEERSQGQATDIGADEIPLESDVGEEGSGDGTAVDWDLLTATPNPANAGSQVLFRVVGQNEEALSVHIHDAVGREIRRVNLEPMGSDELMARWDGLRSDGQPVPAGVYLATVSRAGAVLGRAKIVLTLR